MTLVPDATSAAVVSTIVLLMRTLGFLHDVRLLTGRLPPAVQETVAIPLAQGHRAISGLRQVQVDIVDAGITAASALLAQWLRPTAESRQTTATRLRGACP